MNDNRPFFEYGQNPFRPEPDASRQVHGAAHWMTSGEADALGLSQSGGIVLGQKQNSDRLYFSDGGHVVVFAPTRAGKGIGFVQPNLIDYQGSMVVLDPKGENAIVSAEYRRRQGHRVLILDPFGKTGMRSDTYNPLGALTFADGNNLGPCIEALADALVIAAPNARDPHWTEGAKKFCSFLMWFMVAHEPPARRNLIRLFEMAHGGYELLAKMATVMAEGRSPDAETARICKALGNWFLGRSEREMSYFDSIAANNFGWIGDFVWSAALSAPPQPPLKLKSKTETLTVYLVLPFSRMQRYQRWLRLMVADCIATLYDTEGAPRVPVLFLLDEAYKGLGKMDVLFDAAPAIASAGGRLCFVYQDVLQAEKLYGPAWESLVANSGVSLFFAVNDVKAADYISRRCGTKTTPIPGNPMGMAEPLIRLEAVLNMPKDEVIGIFRNAPPAKFGRLNVLTDARYKTKLAPNTTYGEVEEKSHVARTEFVPVDLDQISLRAKRADDEVADESEYAEDRQTAQLSKEFGRKVVKDADGNFGILNERGFFIPLTD